MPPIILLSPLYLLNSSIFHHDRFVRDSAWWLQTCRASTTEQRPCTHLYWIQRIEFAPTSEPHTQKGYLPVSRLVTRGLQDISKFVLSMLTLNPLRTNASVHFPNMLTIPTKTLFSRNFLRTHQNSLHILNQCIKTFDLSYQPHLYDIFHLILILNLGYYRLFGAPSA